MSIQVSKLVSLILRHEPARFGVVLDRAGWTSVDALLAALAKAGHVLTREALAELVATSDKQRFALSADGQQIRANQGHSLPTEVVDLELAAATPPAVLYHGTVDRFLASIREVGLVRGTRQYVHLSADRETAQKVGGRRGKPIVLEVAAAQMTAAGHAFFRSANGVWLVEAVPPVYLDLPPAPKRPGDIARGAKVKIAKGSLAACDAGFYVNGHGERVELAPAIAVAVAGTMIASPGELAKVTRAPRPTEITVTGESTIQALVRLAGRGHVGCLNFASAKHPGGGFLGGAQAQEESLARASALYPCLCAAPGYYDHNRANRSPAYTDLAIYSPRVPFFRDDRGGWFDAPVLASVITCPAPNAGALAKYNTHDALALRAIFVRRGGHVLEIARHFGIDTLVLGAWGAGVFRNDPAMVASVFAELLAGEFAGAFAEVTFAVLGEHAANYEPFRAALSS